MNVLIRTDSSSQLGSGHAFRCLALAEEFRRQGASVSFLCGSWPGNINDVLEKNGFRVHRMEHTSSFDHEASPADGFWEEDLRKAEGVVAGLPGIDCLVVDHYNLDLRWESALRRYANAMLVIDDLANRSHDCDLLLDQNLHGDQQARYDGLLPTNCKVLLGPEYALLRQQFSAARPQSQGRDGHVNRILVSFGGADPANQTAKALSALCGLGRDEISVDVVLGPANPRRARLPALFPAPNIRFHHMVEDMAALVGAADLAIGSGGVTAWERCCLAVPAVVISVSSCEESPSRALEQRGCVVYLGNSSEVTVESLAQALQELLHTPERLRAMAERSFALVDGLGARRVVGALTGHLTPMKVRAR